MNFIHRQRKYSVAVVFTLTVLMALAMVTGIAIPALAQPADHPPAFFPYPSTFPIKPAICGLSSVAAAAVGDFNNDGKLDVVSICAWEIDVTLGNGDGTFQYPIVNTYTMPSNTTPYDLAVGDFNGDGKLDLAVWSTYAPASYNEVIIFLGDGAGHFTYSNTYPAPNGYSNPGPNSLYAADFNGDGKLDLAALAPYCGSTNSYSCVYIFLGNGDGTFQPGAYYSTIDPNHPNNVNVFGMAVGELGASGKPDIAVTQSGGVSVLLNNGNGTFGTATYYDAALCCGDTAEIGLAIGDVNGDKKNDIVITTNRYGYMMLYLNQGNGTFTFKGSVATVPGSNGSWLVTMADINGDKKLDLVVTDNDGEIWTFFGKGNGTFSAGAIYPLQRPQDVPPSNVVLADFNEDGVLDVFIAGNQYNLGQVALGRSDGTFQTNAAYAWADSGFGRNLVTADFNGDGFPDVAYSYARNSTATEEGFEVALGSSHGVLGTPTFVEVAGSCGGFTEWIATADVNGDGRADVVATVDNSSNTGCPNNEVAVLLGQGNGKFGTPVYYSTGSAAQSYDVFFEDVNGDGKPDIITSNWDGTISVLLNNGKGAFPTAKLITGMTTYNPRLNSLAFGDFNGDGKLDIAVVPNYRVGGSNVSNTAYILLGNGDGTFQAPIVIENLTQDQYTTTERLAAGDFNNDGKMDLIVALDSRSPCWGIEYVVLQGNGDGTFTPEPEGCTGNTSYYDGTPVYPVVADFNADGNLDVFIPLLQYGHGAGPVLLEGNGNGTFTQLAGYDVDDPNLGTAWLGSGFYVGQASYGAAVADFNGDGTPDIAVLNNNTYQNVDYVSFVTVMFNSTQPVSVSPLTLNFGSVVPPATKSLTILVTNNQPSALTISSITVGGTNASDFSAMSNCGTSLKAGFECTITVKFTPPVLGAQSATLSIKDSVGTQVVQLIATNPVPAVKTLSPSSALAGGAGFTLTLTGTGYLSSSDVNWNGSPRATTYVSSTELTAVINATDIAKAGTFRVTVTNPAPGGGTGAAVFTVDNPVPTLLSISPSSATHGGKAFTLTASGTNYVSTSSIEWNGTKLTTKYVSSTTLTTTVPASDIATAGTANVTVVNPTPGGGTSGTQTFTIN